MELLNAKLHKYFNNNELFRHTHIKEKRKYYSGLLKMHKNEKEGQRKWFNNKEEEGKKQELYYCS